MKCYFLAAGLGERLKPLTDHTPKCLLPIGGKPLMEYWFALFQHHGISEVVINTHHLADRVEDFLADGHIKKLYPEVKVRIIHERELLGTGGSIKMNRDFVQGGEHFFIIYGDNLTDIDLSAMVDYHLAGGMPLTMALFRPENPRACGIAVVDDYWNVVDFQEKPENPLSPWANAGIFVADYRLFDYFPPKDKFDLGFDVLPAMRGRIRGYPMREFLIDIGSPENYRKAQLMVRELNFTF